MGVSFNNGSTLNTVGYWPTKIFTHLVEYAELVQWGGKVTNVNIYNQHISTEMGSGYFLDGGLGKTVYMQDLEITANKTAFQPLYDLMVV